MAPGTRARQQTPLSEGGEVKKQDAKITLYWLEKSRSQRILWLLEELQLNYTLQTFKRVNMFAPPELTAVHPLGKSPVITIESEATSTPITIAESGFIIEYLIDHFGPWLAPARYREGMEGKVGGETEEWMRYRYLMHYGEGSLMTLLVTAVLLRGMNSSTPYLLQPLTRLLTSSVESAYLTPNLQRHFSFLESQLATSPGNGAYLCGTALTGADILLSFPLGAARGRAGLTQEGFPRLWAYVGRVEGREAFMRAVGKIVEVEGAYEGAL